MKSNAKQSGVTLIEVLVTMVIMAIALSGIAAMQATSMQSASQLKYRSAAMSSAQSILDTMRSNRNGSTTDALASLQEYIGSDDNMPDAGTQAGDDYVAIKAEVDSSLANRSPGFEISVSDDRLVTVSISWTQRKDAEEGTDNKTYSVSAYL